MSSRFIRVSGILLLVSGLLVAISWSFHPFDPDHHAMQSTRWLLVHGLASIGLVLCVPGLMGLYSQLADEGGILGLISFILATIGTALLAGMILFIEVAALPLIATLPDAEELLNATPPAFMATFAMTVLSFVLGFILLSIVLLRSTTLPRRAGLLLLIGAPLFAAPVPPAPVIVNTIGAVLFGLGYIWLGYVLQANTGKAIETRPQIKPAS